MLYYDSHKSGYFSVFQNRKMEKTSCAEFPLALAIYKNPSLCGTLSNLVRKTLGLVMSKSCLRNAR